MQRRSSAPLTALILVALLAACAPPRKSSTTGTATPEARTPVVRFEEASFASLAGWSSDTSKDAWPAFVASCGALRFRVDWKYVCELARERPTVGSDDEARAFFETQFDLYRVVADDGRKVQDTGLITSYYEPLLKGARLPSPEFDTPLYAIPDDLLIVDLGELYPSLKGERVRGRLQGRRVVPYYDRGALDAAPGVQGKQIVWVNDALDAFFLQIQGSGRVQLQDGTTIRLAYADVNGQPYRSIGRYLIDRGELTTPQATGPGIRQWLREHPERLQEVLNANPSVVFFNEEQILDPAQGPKGALGVPLTAGRSIAVDPRNLPLGAPYFLSTTHPASTSPLMRLVLAQDTGGAIRGIVRADYFWGLGHEAGEQAGNMRQSGRMWLLWPKGKTPPLPAPPAALAPR